MEFISKQNIVGLSNPDVVSRQLLNPENSSSEKVTLTEVLLEVGASQPRHMHEASEQIWYALKGAGKLLLANDEEKELIKEVLCDIVDHILENNYRLCDVDGLPTTWAIWDPEQLNRNNMWVWEKCINSLELLTFLNVAYHVSGDEKYRNEFLRLAVDEHYLLNAAQHKKDDGHTNHIDDNLGFLCTMTILRIEKNPAIRKYLLMGLKHHWEYERTENCALYSIVYGAFSDDSSDLDHAVKSLREYPLDFVNRPMFNSSRKGLVYDTEQEKWGEPVQLKEALDIDARNVHNYDTNPFRADEGHGRSACSPTPYLLPYWFGRYYGIIEE